MLLNKLPSENNLRNINIRKQRFVILKVCMTSDESKLLPEASDFGVHWIETRPGAANKKTGILPSLYTVSTSNFLLAPGQFQPHLSHFYELHIIIFI